jgi:hypothetical protein
MTQMHIEAATGAQRRPVAGARRLALFDDIRAQHFLPVRKGPRTAPSPDAIEAT